MCVEEPTATVSLF